jgi:hypothetical protein
VSICCRGNVFTEPLPSNDRGIHTQTHGESRLITEELLEAVFSLRSDPKLYITYYYHSYYYYCYGQGKPCIGNIKELNLAAVNLTAVQLTSSVSEWLN